MKELPSFSVNSYDHEGDEFEEGIFLHFENTRIKVADDLAGLNNFIEHLQRMQKEILEIYINS